MTSADQVPGGWTPDRATIEDANRDSLPVLAPLTPGAVSSPTTTNFVGGVRSTDLEWFWDAIWKSFDIQAATAAPRRACRQRILASNGFRAPTLNYVTGIFRHAVDGRPAMVVVADEDGSSEWSWERLRQETAAFAAYLRSVGVEPGDRVVGYLPNIGEAVVAFLGAASVGSTWAVCNQDLAISGVVARLGQLEPTVLVTSDGSVYAGKRRDRHAELAEIRSQLPTLRATVLVPRPASRYPGISQGLWSRRHPRTARGPCASLGPGVAGHGRLVVGERLVEAPCRRYGHGSVRSHGRAAGRYAGECRTEARPHGRSPWSPLFLSNRTRRFSSLLHMAGSKEGWSWFLGVDWVPSSGSEGWDGRSWVSSSWQGRSRLRPSQHITVTGVNMPLGHAPSVNVAPGIPRPRSSDAGMGVEWCGADSSIPATSR